MLGESEEEYVAKNDEGLLEKREIYFVYFLFLHLNFALLTFSFYNTPLNRAQVV